MPAVSVVALSSEIARADWQRLAPAGHPFLNADFFAILERHQTAGPASGWQARHWLARDGDRRVVGLLPGYLKAHSHGDFVGDWSWAAAYQQLGKAYFPKLLSGVPHTPAAGPRLLLGGGEGEETGAVRRGLIEAVKAEVEARQLSSWHVALPAAADVDLLAAHGLLVSHDVQFHWRNRGYGDFDEYLAAFPSEKRRKVKAERRKVAASGLRIEVRHGDELDPAEWPRLHQLYASTFDKYGNHAAFSPGCFADLATALGRRMVLFIARQGGEPVAIAICFRSVDTLYGRYWGCAGDYHSLHFELCMYQGIAYCLAHGLNTFEPGAGGEHKVARGFEPTIVRSCHWIADERMRQLIGQHLVRQQAHVAAYAAEAATHLPFRPAG
ncbi:MAG TPA: GNAT family N-acetyltransferase [Azonexus sp.]|nr:GNAT family N-acetyltransferase [Azonexus sp.]